MPHFIAAFPMIFLTETNDKIQITVAGTLPVIPVWIGATLALFVTSAWVWWQGENY